MRLRSTRIKRTRPSEVYSNIVAGEIDFVSAHKNTTLHGVLLEENEVITPKKKKRVKKKKRSAVFYDLSKVKLFNAIFEDANDFSLIIEKVPEDGYILPTSKVIDQPSTSTNYPETENWSIDESVVISKKDRSSILSSFSHKKFVTSTPKNNNTTLFLRQSLGNFLNEKSFGNQIGISNVSYSVFSDSRKNSFSQIQDDGRKSEKNVLQSITNNNLENATFNLSKESITKDDENNSLQKKKFEVIEEGLANDCNKIPLNDKSNISNNLKIDFIEIEPITKKELEILNNSTINKKTDYTSALKTKRHSLNEIFGNKSHLSITLGQNVSLLKKNTSQLIIDNPLKIFYYLRDFVGELKQINYLLHACKQSSVMQFDEFLPSNLLKGCKKLGEGVYGEVFKTTIENVPVALKIIPFIDEECTFEGLVNGERMKETLEILPELLITKELSELANEQREELFFDKCRYVTTNFVQLIQASVIRGNYPNELLVEWDRYAKITKKSENDRPNLYSSNKQLFIAFALSLGGRDLENYNIRNEKEAFSIFFQIALSLAIAEEVLEFEHRDLHVGNVLVAQCKVNEKIRYVFNSEEIVMKSCGVNVSIIDFTNSRMQKEETTIFLDLANDKELFEGTGNYQFDIYRLMRECNGDNWKVFTPYTNVLWLHYIATNVFASKKIPIKRRKEIMNDMDLVLKFKRIKYFLESEKISQIFEDFVVKDNEKTENKAQM